MSKPLGVWGSYMAEKQTFKVHQLTIDDALDLGGILAAGGLTGQASRALTELQRDEAAAVGAITQLVMGALASRTTRDDMRGFLFTIWKTTEDEQADEDDLDVAGRLKPRYSSNGEPTKGTTYYRKLQRFHKLPPSALVGLGKAVYESDGFADFLELLRMELPTGNLSTAQQTESSEPTPLTPVQ